MEVSIKITDRQIREHLEELVFSLLPEDLSNDIESHIHVRFRAVCYDGTEVDLSKESLKPYHLEAFVEGRTFEDEGD